MALALILLLAACRRETRDPVLVVTSAEVAGTGLPQLLTQRFAAESGVPVELRIVDVVEEQEAVLVTNDAALVQRLRPRARLTTTFARDDFLIAGPRSDPAGVARAKTAPEAFRRIAEGKRAFCSASGIPRYRAREAAIWKAAGVDPRTNRRYRLCHGDPATLLRDTASRRAYTIIDRSAPVPKELKVLLQGTPLLRNDYTAMLMTRKRKPRNAEWFMQWLMSYRGRAVIAEAQK
ncbi:MAG TPA: hypothetical protein VF618_09445 [Thermoanaerobaculia bacterium]